MISKKIKKMLALTLTGAMMIGFTACSSNDVTDDENNEPATQQNSLERIKESGKLVIGTNPDYPPFEFKDKNQEVVGSDIEIAKELASDLGVELVIQEAQFDSLVPMVKAKKIDLAIAGMNEDPERKKEVDFSDIYYTGESVLIIRKSDADKYKLSIDTKKDSEEVDYEELVADIQAKLKGKTIGAQLGSVPQSIAEDQLKGSKTLPLGMVSDLILQLKGEKVDALIMDDIVAEAYVENNADLMIIEGAVLVSEDSGFAIAVPKGDKELLVEINKTLARLESENKLQQFLQEAMELKNK